ncbi:hypothetical protein [Klebsiella sp. BIGb0407]|uniref:hypothetical protein n=1 Tax=Klebsiella sp. BIGb0407 TaxID=2940603 RepID=UPI00216A54AE|nr:hypothetical protein [Klebsiella sp. BIGb0407]MCS3434238.1 hypothetical protein [Klebsiella sp. BIGb0407]
MVTVFLSLILFIPGVGTMSILGMVFSILIFYSFAFIKWQSTRRVSFLIMIAVSIVMGCAIAYLIYNDAPFWVVSERSVYDAALIGFGSSSFICILLYGFNLMVNSIAVSAVKTK